MHVCMYVCMYGCMYVCMDGWMDGWMDVCMYVCMYVCNFKCLIIKFKDIVTFTKKKIQSYYILYITYIYICMHTIYIYI